MSRLPSKPVGSPTYSLRLVQPFTQLLGIPVDKLPVQAHDPDARIPVAQAHEMLETAVRVRNDPDFGLRASTFATPGDAGAFDYAVRSARTVREALDMQLRYFRLVNDAASLRLEIEGKQARLLIDPIAGTPRAAADYAIASLYRNHVASWLGSDLLEVWFGYPAPEEQALHREIFGAARLRFGQGVYGFVFSEHLLGNALPYADPRLHSLIRNHADQLLQELPPVQSLSQELRQRILDELPHGHPTAEHFARKLHMSPRTLVRRLGNEGTTFSALLDDVRRGLAMRYVASRDLPLADVAFLLGFADATVFHRAFKRWTGKTPREHRRGHHDPQQTA